MSLTDIYINVTEDCYVDNRGVYKDSEKVALDNTANTGYIRWNGDREIERIGNAIYSVTKPLVFVGCSRGSDPSNLLRATIASLVGGGVEIQRATLDKKIIAENENIDIEDLRKFDGVAMIWIEYQETTTEVFNIPSVRDETPVVVFGVFDDTFDLSFN